MKLQCTWIEKMKFTAESGIHSVVMDTKSPLGSDSALTPKQLLLASVCGCTAMDVVALMKKYKQVVDSFKIDASAEVREDQYPNIFKKINLLFDFTGQVDAKKAIEAVELSQTKYCAVSAMVSKTVPIFYQVQINGNVVGEGQAKFN